MKGAPGQLMSNHAFDLAFSIDIPQDRDWEDISPDEFFTAVYDRIVDLYENGELVEAIGAPFDSFDYQEPEGED